LNHAACNLLGSQFPVVLLLLGQLAATDGSTFPKELQTATLNATVRVVAPDSSAIGSGVIVQQSGAFVYIITAAHLVEKTETAEVAVYSAQSLPKPAKVYAKAQVIARSQGPDLALLRLVTRDPMPGVLPILPPGKELADKFAALTCGLDADKVPACWTDTVNGKKAIRKPSGEMSTVWELEREPNPGRSGGPLLDKRGFVIGIGSGRSAGKGYYVHLDEIHRFLKQNDALRLLEAPKE
jgi:serine protease Do